MSNYPDGSNTSNAPWNWVPPTEIPFDELKEQERGDCATCGKENVVIHGMKYPNLVCRECYGREPEYYEDDL